MSTWTIAMARRYVSGFGGDPDQVTAEMLTAFDEEFPDLRASLEALGKLGRKLWSESESSLLEEIYPDKETVEVCREIGVSPEEVYRRAGWLGLKKSPAFRRQLAREAAERLQKVGRDSRFRAGHEPHNKGVEGWEAGGRSAHTQFKPGHRPHTWKPVGSETVDRDGYLKRKVSNKGKRAIDRWKYVHVLAWEEENGPVPDGHAVVFRDGDRRNITIQNLEVVSRAELMSRNTIHHLPEPIKKVLFVKARLTRVIGERQQELDNA